MLDARRRTLHRHAVGLRPRARVRNEGGGTFEKQTVPDASSPTRMALPDPTSLPDDTLARRIAGGDLDALGVLYDRHVAALFRTAWRITGSRPDAEDVVQDVFVGLPVALRRYAERGTLVAWLRVVTTRVALDHVRRRSRHREVALDEAAVVAASARDPERVVALEQALAALPEPLRLVYVLHEIEGYAHAEIAALLGIRTGTSHVRLHRALRRLRAALRPLDRES